MSNNKDIDRTIQILRDEVRILRHPPGSIRRSIEIELIADRKIEEARKRSAKLRKKASTADDQDALALHAIKTAHGLVKSVHGKLPSHLQDPSIRTTGRSRSGRAHWQQRGFTLEQVRTARGGRRGSRESSPAAPSRSASSGDTSSGPTG